MECYIYLGEGVRKEEEEVMKLGEGVRRMMKGREMFIKGKGTVGKGDMRDGER